jgi:DNA-directed RNA polymerase subunit RPC12/RpoP
MKKNVIELRDVARRFAPAYVAGRGEAMLPSQRKALADIAACRTRAMGGRRYRCGTCGKGFWIYHACRNRACPACNGRRTREWVESRQAQLLGCDYYHVVATVPAPLRAVFLSDQKRMYSLLMKTVAECVIDLTGDPRYVGGLPAVMAVLHTWSRDLQFHPHAHLLVSAGGLSPDGERWIEPRCSKWLVPVRALSALIRGRFHARLKRIAPEVASRLPAKVWRKGWNVFCKPCATRADAVVQYLGRYVFRTAISNARIEAMDATHVMFRFRSRRKNAGWSRLRLRGEEFLRRFVMHVLPRGFQKVRYYGLWHHSKSDEQERIAQMLRLDKHGRRAKDLALDEAGDEAETPRTIADLVEAEDLGSSEEHTAGYVRCPHCSSASVRQTGRIRRHQRRNRSP